MSTRTRRRLGTPTARPSGRATLAAVAMVAAMVGCAQEHPGGGGPTSACPPCSCAPVAAVDPGLMAFLSKARAAHHEADLAEQNNAPEQAIAALQKLIDGPRPGKQPSPEVREVLADTYGRLAELRSTAGEFDAARRDIDQGLELATELTHFRGRLFEIRGVVEQRLAKDRKAQGDDDGAKQATDRAIAAFQEAVRVQDEVILSTLGDGGALPGLP